VRITSRITQEAATLSFGVVHLGDHNVSAGVRRYQGEESYVELANAIRPAFERADWPEAIRLLDREFGGVTYSLRSLFKDEQRQITDIVLRTTMREVEATYRQIYDHHAPLMRFLADSNVPAPPVLRVTTDFVLNQMFRRMLREDEFDMVRFSTLWQVAHIENVQLDLPGIAYSAEQALERSFRMVAANPRDVEVLTRTRGLLEMILALKLQVNLWGAQNLYYDLLTNRYRELCPDPSAHQWCDLFLQLGEKLHVNVAQHTPEHREVALAS
jgi:hypothetical protein